VIAAARRGRRRLLAAILGMALGLASAAPARAAEAGHDRCLVLGPLVISSYIGLLDEVARGNRAMVSRRSQSAADIVTLYQRLGCPRETLIAAIECLSSHVVAPQTQDPLTAVARQCMENAGMPTR